MIRTTIFLNDVLIVNAAGKPAVFSIPYLWSHLAPFCFFNPTFMKYLFLLCFCMLLFQSCNFAERERKIEQRNRALFLKEQQLSEQERRLLAREQEILKRENRIDSTFIDSAFFYHKEIIGDWYVEMKCTETNCPGSAVGDTKAETWIVGYQSKLIVARVMENDKLTRVYTGYYSGETLELSYQDYNAAPDKTTIMTIRLKETVPGQMEGEREISRVNDCRIVYSVRMKKQ